MARSDLLLSLASASMTGDQKTAKNVIEAIIAEERAKNHKILAGQLLSTMESAQERSAALPGSSNRLNGRSSPDECIMELVPKKKIDDLILSQTNSRACHDFIEEQKRGDLLQAHGMEPRSRVLLIGPPGNGKTSLAEAIASSLAFPFFVVRYDSLIASYLGETATRLRHVFDYARTTPCVLFFDEFDTLGKERGDKHETGEIKRVVSSLLLQIDNLPSYTILIAATNHPELLDRAVWRRFQLRLELSYPSQNEREDYINNFTERVNEKFHEKSKEIARKLGKISFAEIEQFCFDVYRSKILCFGEKDMRNIVNEQLKMRFMRVSEPIVKGVNGCAKISDT